MKNLKIFGAVIGVGILLVALWRGGIFRNSPSSENPTVDDTSRGVPQNPKLLVASNAGRPNQTLSMPSHIKALLKDGHETPDTAITSRLTTSDVTVLMQLYLQQTNLYEKNSLTWALALVGDEQTVELFKRVLTTDSPQGKLSAGYAKNTLDEESVLFGTVTALGLLAARHDSAYAFLKQGFDPWFWKKNIHWSSDRGADTVGILTSRSIQALGMTGRPDVLKLLLQLKETSLRNTTDPNPVTRTFEGAVMDAVFYNSIVQSDGVEGFRSWYFKPWTDVFDDDGRRARYFSTPEGKAWRAWSNERDGIPAAK